MEYLRYSVRNYDVLLSRLVWNIQSSQSVCIGIKVSEHNFNMCINNTYTYVTLASLIIITILTIESIGQQQFGPISFNVPLVLQVATHKQLILFEQLNKLKCMYGSTLLYKWAHLITKIMLQKSGLDVGLAPWPSFTFISFYCAVSY